MSALYAISVRQSGTLPAEALFSLCIRLPSDSTSRWTPLPSANASYHRAHSGLSPPSYCPCRAHQKESGALLRSAFFFNEIAAIVGGFHFAKTVIFWFHQRRKTLISLLFDFVAAVGWHKCCYLLWRLWGCLWGLLYTVDIFMITRGSIGYKINFRFQTFFIFVQSAPLHRDSN